MLCVFTGIGRIRFQFICVENPSAAYEPGYMSEERFRPPLTGPLSPDPTFPETFEKTLYNTSSRDSSRIPSPALRRVAVDALYFQPRVGGDEGRASADGASARAGTKLGRGVGVRGDAMEG